MQTTLNVFGRLAITGQVLPESGSIDEAIACEEIRSKLELSEDEQEALQIEESEQGGLRWNREADEPREYEFTEQQVETIQKGFELLSAKEEMPTSPRFITLYRTFQNGEAE